MSTPRRNLPLSTKNRIAASQQWTCALCHQLLSWSFDADHILPLADGGTNELDNFWILCPNCHRIKTMHEADERRAKEEEDRTGISRFFSKLP
jgi:5-methylcytosine-specific restriction protein A